jgi:glycine betaine/proline transport system substrate-binding protein
MRGTTKLRLAAGLAAGALALSGCGGSDIKDTDTGAVGGGAADCGELNLAVNPWVGMEASAYVVGRVAETQLGCTVNYVKTKEELSWAGFGTSEVDVIVEDWGHPDLEKQYFSSKGGDGTAENIGSDGNEGVIHWYVPPWLAEAHPDVLDWQNLNKYASDFATSESGGQGQFLGADPSYVQYDEAIIKNLDLNFKVVFSGGEAASISAFQKAEKDHEWLIGYFYEPQWLFAQEKLVPVKLPPYKPGCEDDPDKVDCDYPVTQLQKVASTDWLNSGSSAVDFIKNWQWTNDDQNAVAEMIANEGMDPADAADKWIADNKDKVDAWLGN